MNIKKRRRINMDIFEMIDIVKKQDTEKAKQEEEDREQDLFWKEICEYENIDYEKLIAPNPSLIKTETRRKK